MACSNPLKITPNLYKSHKVQYSDPVARPLLNLDSQTYYTVPCGYCLNCRVDKANQLTHRCEYEYIQFGCGSFVTFTFDDYHLSPYQFINSKTGEVTATLSKKAAREFLDRLHKIVEADNKKTGFNPLCRKDFKYMLVGEYGENGQLFDRPHFHCLFFGLDFAYCERLFWKAWQYQGSIQVGGIRNGGIGYCLKYLDKQLFGRLAWFKYDYNHLQRPFQIHSSYFGDGLYKGQLKYIKEHKGNYHWHGHDYPVPVYYKNKLNILSDRPFNVQVEKYLDRKNQIYNLYEHRITSFEDYKKYNLMLAKQREENFKKSCMARGKVVFDKEYFYKQVNDLVYKDNHRLPTLFDKDFCVIIDNNFNHYLKVDNRIKKHLTTRDLMKLHTDYNILKSRFGFKTADQLIFTDKIPF